MLSLALKGLFRTSSMEVTIPPPVSPCPDEIPNRDPESSMVTALSDSGPQQDPSTCKKADT